MEEWEICLIDMMRVLLNDPAGVNQQYSDERILQILRAAAYYVVTDLNCCSVVSAPTLGDCGEIPDDILDYPSFVNLLLLRATCMVDQGSYRTKLAAEGVKAVCGPVSLSVLSSASGFSTLFTHGACHSYNELKYDLCVRCPAQSAAYCKQIINLGVDYNGCWCS